MSNKKNQSQEVKGGATPPSLIKKGATVPDKPKPKPTPNDKK